MIYNNPFYFSPNTNTNANSLHNELFILNNSDIIGLKEIDIINYKMNNHSDQVVDINSFFKFDEDKILNSYSKIEDYYLPINDYYYKNDIKSLDLDFNIFISGFDERKDLGDLKKQIQKLDIDKTSSRNVGPISTLDYLVETSFNSDYFRKKSIIENFISLEDVVFRWRRIAGDGNCYYRAVIFAYFESLIFEFNIDLLKFLILDIYEAFFKDEYLIKKMNCLSLNRELIIKILLIIYYSVLVSLQNNDATQTYELYLNCFNYFKDFDHGLIFYFRYKLYEFIKDNENKIYTQFFSVKIGNLLPKEYETDKGEFYYEKFYEDYLMKFYKDAEKIVIYLTPFVLKVNINILAYDFCKNNVEKLKEFPCMLEEDKGLTTLTLLYKRNHYDLIYEEKYFQKYSKYLTLYVKLDENLRIINNKTIHEFKCKRDDINSFDIRQEEGKGQSLNNNSKANPITDNDFNSNGITNNINEIEDIKYNDNSDKDDLKNIQTDIQNFYLFNIKDKNINYKLKEDNKCHNLEIDNPLNNQNNNQNSSRKNYISEFTSHCNQQEKNPLVQINFNQNIYPEFEMKDNSYIHPQISQSPHKNINFNVSNLNSNVEIISSNYLKHTELCSICCNRFIPYDTLLKICKSCLTTEFKSIVLSRYLNFIDCSKKNYENKQYSSEAQKLFKIIMLDNKIIITNEIFNVNQVLKLIDSEFNEFLSKEIKSSICVTCEQNFNDSYREISSAKNQSRRQTYILPCKCSFCSLPCLKKHLELFFQANYKLKELYCLCGINYDNNMLKDLFSYCCMYDLKKFKEKIVDIFKNKIKSQCMICLLEINKKGKFDDEDTIITIQLRDDNVETIFNLKKFKHFICLNCLKQLYPSFNLDKTSNEKVPFDQLCMICNSMHRINKFIAEKSTSQSNNECNII